VDLQTGEWILVAGAGLAAGGVNAVAGGGSLISFPALLGVGYPSLTANVTNLVSLVPGYASGSLAYRRELRGQRGRLLALGATSAVGAAVGAVLLVLSPESTFERIVPWLILVSCALLAAQPALARAAERTGRRPRLRSVRLHLLQLGAAIYGGYFGAGLGIMLLAVLGIELDDDLQRLNALKGLLSLLISAVAAAYFALFGPVEWGPAAAIGVASVAGGYVGVALARRLDERLLRWLVVAFGVAVAVVLLV
jgi:uncharacterized membrane protein YfcA